MAIKSINSLQGMTAADITANDVLVVGTPGDSSNPVKKIPAAAAFSGGGGSSVPDIVASCTCEGLPGSTYGTMSVEFNDTLDNISDKVDDSTLRVGGFCECQRGGLPWNLPIYLTAISIIPQQAISSYGLTSLSKGVLLTLHMFEDIPAADAGPVKCWDNLIYYTEGDSSSPNYGEIVQLQI